MLDSVDLKLLARWCHDRRLRWMTLRAADGSPAVLLRPTSNDCTLEGMLLVEEHDGFRLMDGPGNTLATASDLPALLDAVDAGVAELATPPAAHERRPRAVAAVW